jgi:hypothetical protein
MSVNIEDHIDCLHSVNVPLIRESVKIDNIISSQISTRTFSPVFRGLYNHVSVISSEIVLNYVYWTLNEYEY